MITGRGTGVKTAQQNYVEEFADVANIRDKLAFSARLAEVIDREVQLALKHAHQENPGTQSAGHPLRSEKRWEPSVTELQKGRALMLQEFRKPHNLTVAAFAELAGKSRQQIYKDVESRRLLVLSIGSRGQRIPDWQLDATRKQLTQGLLERAHGVDEWTLYYSLTKPNRSFAGKPPLGAVTPRNLERSLDKLLAQLGFHD
jgi:hypothetical protein